MGSNKTEQKRSEKKCRRTKRMNKNVDVFSVECVKQCKTKHNKRKIEKYSVRMCAVCDDTRWYTMIHAQGTITNNHQRINVCMHIPVYFCLFDKSLFMFYYNNSKVQYAVGKKNGNGSFLKTHSKIEPFFCTLINLFFLGLLCFLTKNINFHNRISKTVNTNWFMLYAQSNDIFQKIKFYCTIKLVKL